MAGHDFNTLMAALDSPLIVVTAADERERAATTFCLTTEPVAVQTAGPFRPLRGSQAGHLRAGHGAGERPEPPTERAAPA